MIRRIKRQARNTKGTGMAEVAVASLILIGMALFALNIGTAMMSYGVNDRACRDAARAAAQGSNSTEANNLASQILKSYSQNGTLLSNPSLVSVNYQDFGGNPPDGVSPFVTVTTRATARSIAPFSLFGSEIVRASFPVTKTYTFPIVKLNVHVATGGGAGG